MSASNVDINSESHKRMKLQYQDKDNFCMPKGALEVEDFSNPFASANLLEDLDDGKYGSVTKEYEKVHAQRKEVINFLSALRLSLANGCSNWEPKFPGGGLITRSDPLTHNKLNLNADSFVLPADHASSHVQHLHRKSGYDSGPSMPHARVSCLSMMKNKVSDVAKGTSDLLPGKDGGVYPSIIILESDEEGDHPVEKKLSSYSEGETCKLQECLESHLPLHLRQAKTSAEDGHVNQLTPYDQQFSKVVVEADWQQPFIQDEKLDDKVVLNNVSERRPNQDLMGEQYVQNNMNESIRRKRAGETLNSGANTEKEPDVHSSPVSYIIAHEHLMSIESHDNGVQDAQSSGLEDLWRDMSLAIECSKSAAISDGSAVLQNEEDCNHSYVLEDDLGLVCRICGVIKKSIETIFDNQWKKGTRSIRTYMSVSRNPEDLDEANEYSGPKLSENNLARAEIFLHPRHMKQMKPHQLEGFSFLVRNLAADKPGGCILAHAPGSGKTFMLISFIQSFLARYPCARPLVVLPKGILATWKREFQRWQVEDIPLYDFYSCKADNRYQQLDVLKSWEDNRSILFLGYQQFATIVSGDDTCKVSTACQERLLKVPGLLILDEGHTPRNEGTDILISLARVQTPRKVVLSGTLFQNHVREVFNILNLVRPKFLQMESSVAVVKRVLSRVYISGGSRIPLRGSIDTKFCELVEETLQNENDDNYKRKITVIEDLRELTKNVLHYYKGDFLDELPGLVDFTLLLNLSDKQREIIESFGKFKRKYMGNFKKSSVGNAVYIHPYLKDIAESAAGDRANIFNDEKHDSILDSLDLRDGVKTKFFFDMLCMTEATGEKLLAFSQYLFPMKFLERLIVRKKGWRVGKEIFTITGDSSTEDREHSVDQFNNSPDAKVLFGSIKACGEGISLVGASRVLILDVHLNPSVTRQAIGRAFRPGQEKKVYVYRLVAANSLEEEDHRTSFKKELISKMWFEWNGYHGHKDFELEEIDAADCQDMFLESPILAEDIKILYRR